MTTMVEKTSSSAKKPSRKREPPFDHERVAETIRLAFKEIEGIMVVRYLWTAGAVHRFRVNWWVNNAIRESKYVQVIKDKGKLTVREIR